MRPYRLPLLFLLLGILAAVLASARLSRKPGDRDARPGTTVQSAPVAGTGSIGAAAGIIPPTLAVKKTYHPPEVANSNLEAFVDKTYQGNRIPDDFTALVPRLESDRDIKAVAAVLDDGEDTDTVRHEAIELLRRSEYPQLTADLLRIFNRPQESPRFRSWVVQHLGEIALQSGDGLAQDRIAAQLVDAIDSPQLAVRREALLALTRMRHPVGLSTTRLWLEAAHPEETRDLAIRCAYELGLTECLPAIRIYATSANATVKIAAMAVLGQWQDAPSRAVLEAASKDRNVLVRHAAECALTSMMGNKGATPSDPPG